MRLGLCWAVGVGSNLGAVFGSFLAFRLLFARLGHGSRAVGLGDALFRFLGPGGALMGSVRAPWGVSWGSLWG